MLTLSVPLTSSFSSILSLLGLDTSAPVGFGLNKAQSSTDTYILWGTLDAAAADASNAYEISQFSGGNGFVLPLGTALSARTWPYLLIQSLTGTGSGTFYATGNPPGVASSVVSATAPTSGAYSSVLNLTSFSAGGVRLGSSKAMTTSDIFDVYVSQDSTVTSAQGCSYIGRITGGGGTRQISVLVQGWPYAIFYRVSGTTVGTVLAAGVAPADIGNHIVATYADLPSSGVPNGAEYYVLSRFGYYLRSNGAWVRTLNTDPTWAQSGDIYVSYASGSDDNMGGLTTPLATVPEAFARLGINPVNSTSFFWVHILDGPTESSWTINAVTRSINESVTITADPSVLLTTTVTVVPWGTVPNTPGTMTGAASLVPYAAASATTDGSLWRISGGPRDGAIGALRRVAVSPAVEYNVGALPWAPGAVEPQTGDTIQILQNITGPSTLQVTADTILFMSGFDMLSGLHAAFSSPGSSLWITGCRFFGGIDADAGSFISVIASSFASTTVRGEEPAAVIEISSSRAGGGLVRSFAKMRIGNTTVEERLLANAGGLIVHAEGYVQTENSTVTSVIELDPRSTWEHATGAGNLQGRNATGTSGVIRLWSGASFVGPAPTIATGGTQFNVGGVAKIWGDIVAGYQNPSNFASIAALA